MRWNGEDQDNAIAGAGPAALPLGPAGPFDRAAWFDLVEQFHWCEHARVDARGQAGGCAATLPLVEARPGHLVSLANWYSFVHRPQFVGGHDAAARHMALTDLFAGLRSRAARLSLYPVSELDASRDALCTALRGAGWWITATAAGDSHWLDLAGLDYDRWWAERPGALRSTIARKAKKNIVAIDIVDRCDPDYWAAYETIYAASWKPAEGNTAMLRAFAEAEGRAGRIRLGLARIDGLPVAAQFWTVEHGCAFIHKLAHLEDSVRASPGSLLTAALFRHVIEIDGVRRIDFGTGNDPYKRDWMNRHNRLWRIEAFNPSRPGAWPAAIASMVGRWRQQGKDA
jgi:Acetyltransferase (GNAT) domain